MKIPSQNKFLQLITTQLKSNNLSHAYLIFGDFDFEKLFKIFQIKIPDQFLINEKPIKINLIRQLIHWINLKPHSSSWRMAVLTNVDNLTLEAANALLKVLEEAPPPLILILNAQRNEKILPTIASRCQIIREKRVVESELPSSYLPSKKIGQMSIKERFDYVSKLLDEEVNLLKIINLWEEDFRQELLHGRDRRSMLTVLAKTRGLLSTNISVKLLLENLVLNF